MEVAFKSENIIFFIQFSSNLKDFQQSLTPHPFCIYAVSWLWFCSEYLSTLESKKSEASFGTCGS